MICAYFLSKHPVCSLDSCLCFSAAPAFSQVKRSHVKLHVYSYITSECDTKILHNKKLPSCVRVLWRRRGPREWAEYSWLFKPDQEPSHQGLRSCAQIRSLNLWRLAHNEGGFFLIVSHLYFMHGWRGIKLKNVVIEKWNQDWSGWFNSLIIRL